MAILKLRDADGNIIEIPAIRGEKGDDGSARDITDLVVVASQFQDNEVQKAVDNGNTIVIWCDGEGSELTISVSGHSGVVVGGYINIPGGKKADLVDCFGSTLSDGFDVGTSTENGVYAIVIHYI